jgi:EmrB/QacA subfamily drug resistance transporter
MAVTPDTTGTGGRERATSAPTVGPTGDFPSDGEPKPGRHLIFAIVSVALVMASIDQTIVSTALPTIQHDLHAPINISSWTITIYALGTIIAMPLGGALSDQLGRKRVFLIAIVLFTVASLACGLADSIYVLVPLRAVQALGGGALVPSASGIVSDQYGRERDRAIGMFTSILPIGGVIGPVLGGVLVTYWSWRGIFLVNVPFGVVLVVLATRYIPLTAKRKAAPVDLLGIALLAVLLIAAMAGIGRLGSGGTTLLDPWFLGLEGIAAVFTALFLRHAYRTSAPFIPPRLLFGRGFLVMNVINVVFGSAALGIGALIPLYAEDRFKISALSSGSLLTARAVGMISVAGLAVLALRRSGYRRPMIGGFFLLAVGMVLLSSSAHGLSPYVWLAMAAGISGVGMGLLLPASNNAMLQLAPEQVAAVTGLRGMFRQSGGILAVSVTTAAIARSSHPGSALGHAFFIFAILVLVMIPMIRLVPEHRGSW